MRAAVAVDGGGGVVDDEGEEPAAPAGRGFNAYGERREYLYKYTQTLHLIHIIHNGNCCNSYTFLAAA